MSVLKTRRIIVVAVVDLFSLVGCKLRNFIQSSPFKLNIFIIHFEYLPALIDTLGLYCYRSLEHFMRSIIWKNIIILIFMISTLMNHHAGSTFLTMSYKLLYLLGLNEQQFLIIHLIE